MKNKLLSFLCCFALILCGVGMLTFVTGCSPKEYNMSAFAVSTNEFNYDGTNKDLVLTGVPEGLEYKFTYYTDETHQETADQHMDAGTYYVKISFVEKKGYKTPEDKFATMTINKVDYDNLIVNIGAHYKFNEESEVVAAKENGDKLYFELNNGTYDVFVVSTNATNATITDKYYADENLTSEKASIISNLGDKLYVEVTVSDKNHNPKTIVKEVEITERTVEMRTFEDLTLMRSHIYGGTYKGKNVTPVAPAIRKHFKYVLMNDINCDGQFWTPVQYILYGGETLDNNGFISEFDGNEHTISNYKITLDSLDQVAANEATSGRQTLYLGFFGYARDAKIHDVTLDGVEISLSREDAKFIMNKNLFVHAGFLVARVSSGGSQNAEETDIYNVTVKNSKMDINADRQIVGGIVGVEYANQGPDGVRNNLKVLNCEIYAYSTDVHQDIFVGGLVGETLHDAPMGFDFGPSLVRLKYSNCAVENIKIGWNYEAWEKAEGEDKAKYMLGGPNGQYHDSYRESLNNQYGLELPTEITYHYEVGTLFGRIYSSFSVENCTVKNYLVSLGNNKNEITGTPKTGFWGYASEGVPGWNTCTYSLSTEWNNGVNGAYGSDGVKHVDYEAWDRSHN